jgi:hypothetical protein
VKIRRNRLIGLLIACSPVVSAQVPHVLGTWKLNIDASKMEGPAPQSEVRSYRLTQDGVLIGVAVTVDDRGQPNFLQFAARPDGKDYPEFSTGSAAQYLIDRTPPPRTYAEKPTADPHRVRWIDKAGGRVLAAGEKWVSKDGKRLSFTVDAKDERGRPIQYLYVFDRTGP